MTAMSRPTASAADLAWDQRIFRLIDSSA